MKYEQLNLYGDDKERFKARGKTPEELEKETRRIPWKIGLLNLLTKKKKRKK